MIAQTFDDSSSVNGKIAGGGGGSSTPDAKGLGGKLPSGVQQNDGTEPRGADTTTKQAAVIGPATGTAKKAAGVQSFDDASV